jgi:hypothetical protein
MKATARLVLATIVCLPARTAAGGTAEPGLVRGWEQVRAADFTAALATLEPLVRRLSLTPGMDRELASAHLALGVACLLGLEQEKAARGHFREALRRDPDASVSGVRQSARVLALLDDVRAQLQEARRSAALESAWSETLRSVEDGGRTEAARIALLRQFIGEFPDPNPHRPTAEQRVAQLQSIVRRRLAAPPDATKSGGRPRAIYLRGTLANVKAGTKGRLSLADPERLVFVADRVGFVPIGYAYVHAIETGQADHGLALTFDDLDGKRQSLVLELDGTELRTVLAALETRSGIKAQHVDRAAPLTR